MHRLVPEFIQENYAQDRTGGSFYACALFVDISGFSNIADDLMVHGQHGAEILANITRDTFDPLMQSIFEQDGFVTNLAGDAFTAVFPAEAALIGTPIDDANDLSFAVSNGDSAVFYRALAAAWRAQEVMATVAEHRTPYGAFAVSVKVGMAAGEVSWGIFTSEDKERSAYYFQGPAIDNCARAEKLANSGEIVVDAAVYEALGSTVSAEPVENRFRVTAIHGALPAPQPVNLRPVEPDILLRFFPPEATRQSYSGEFRQVVSMFVSLPTMRTEEQLASFMQVLFRLQDRYGGLLNGLDFGDKGASLLFFWGAPVSYENDVVRALNFILDLQSQTVIPVNAGVSYRIAHAGYSGGALAGEYTCHGRGVNLAARFMQAAPRGEVWVDENVAERADPYFEVEFEEELSFKGFAEKQKVFVLLGRKEEIRPLYKGEMVGRQAEQERLAAFVQPIWRGQHPGAAVIWGEPGIGKSRLAYNFLQHLERTADPKPSVFTCQADEILRESLNPFRYWLRGYFGQSEEQSDARNKRSFNRKLDHLIAAMQDERLTTELDRTRSFLGALVNLEWRDSLYEQLDPEHRYENSFAGLLTLLEAESQQQPVILLLEDAQWLDGDSKAFLQQLNHELTRTPYPIALLATARQEADRAVLGEGVPFQEIDLSRLTADELNALAAKQLESPVGPGLLNLLAERAEGNPFFAEQILRYLQEEELLQLKGDEWGLKAEQEMALPTDVRAVLVARLDRLTQELKEVVQAASVLGREFEVRLLARMLRDDTVGEKVVQAEHVSIWSALTELRYFFKHTLLRDAAYHMQVRARRHALHELAAEALEELYEDDLTPHYGELAYHAEEALLTDKARHFLEMAGKTAAADYHNELAIEYYSRALKLTPDEDLESRYRLLRARMSVYHRLGKRAEELRDLEARTALAEQSQDADKQVEVLVAKAWLRWWTDDYTGSFALAQRAAALAGETGQEALAASINYVGAWALLPQDRYSEARPYAEKALAGARETNDESLEASILSLLGLISRGEGDYFAAQKRTEESLHINRKRGDLSGEGNALSHLGVMNMTLGDHEAAKEHFLQALAISREIGSKSGIGSNLVNLGWNAERLGDWESAVEYGQEGVAIAREIDQNEFEAEGLLWLGHAWLGLGQFKKAAAAYEESLGIRLALAQEYLVMGVLAGMARAALAQGDLASAGRHAAEIVSYLDEGGSLTSTWEPLRIYLTCYQVLHSLQDGRAGEILATAHQQLQELANRIPDKEVRRMFLENVPWNVKIVAAHREPTAGG